MPVQYAGVIEEHLAVREKAGLFDVSHMGEIEIRGAKALDAVQRLTSNDAARLADGEAQYSALTRPNGAPVDDILVYRLAADRFLLVVNAANDAKDLAWISDNLVPGAVAESVSDDWAQIAVQGPLATSILAGLTASPIAAMKPFSFINGAVAGRNALISRTGYTGEDGFELYCAPDDAVALWGAIVEAGTPRGLAPAGLGARDTLRLESCLCLYGNDIDDTTTLLEAGLAFIVKLDKGEFIGREALLAQKRQGLARRLTGFEMVERGIARHGYPVTLDGAPAGIVTSGTYGPFIRKNVGLVYLPAGKTGVGQPLDIMVRARPVRAQVVPMPFYRRPKAGA